MLPFISSFWWCCFWCVVLLGLLRVELPLPLLLRAAAFLLFLSVVLLSPTLLLGGTTLPPPSLGGVLGGATFPLSSVGWCCSAPSKKGKQEKQKNKLIKDVCRKRCLTRWNRSIWAVFPRQIYSLFFFLTNYDPKKEKKRENKEETKQDILVFLVLRRPCVATSTLMLTPCILALCLGYLSTSSKRGFARICDSMVDVKLTVVTYKTE